MLWKHARHVLTLAVVCWSAVAQAAPAPKPETPADPIERMKLTNASTLLRNEAVVKDVELSDEQKKKIDDARKEMAEKRRAEMQQRLGVAMPALPPGAVGGGGIAIAGGGGIAFPANLLDALANGPELETAIVAALKPEQIRRLKQIAMQAKGPSALLDRRIIRALALSAEQEDKIDDLTAASTASTGFGAIAQPDADKRAEVVDKAWADALKVLDKDQKASWDKIVGKALPTKELLNITAPVRGGGFAPAIRVAPVPGIALPALPVAPPVAPPAKEERKP